ncbi:MAG: hypothetical protein DME98_03540 [Verrucomicrobia bacterium]|nr:MAG: hypothetical protein DME98_03540 [Verrucomicrobiota bacterium]PYJ32457.1 MAG: hypothetical protein DME88_10895 [Verrucomicrobiota bacterium]
MTEYALNSRHRFAVGVADHFARDLLRQFTNLIKSTWAPTDVSPYIAACAERSQIRPAIRVASAPLPQVFLSVLRIIHYETL